MPGPAFAQYSTIYQNYRELAFEALEKRDYQRALLFFETAQSVQPGDPELVHYINLVKRLIENRIEDLPVQEKGPISDRKEKTAPVLPDRNISPERVTSKPAVAGKPVRSLTAPDLSKTSGQTSPSEEIVRDAVKQRPEKTPAAALAESDPDWPSAVEKTSLGTRAQISGSDDLDDDGTLRAPAMADKTFPVELIELTDYLWGQQPNTLIELPLDTKLVIRSYDRISRFLVTAPEVIDIAQSSRTEIEISPVMRSQTFLHIWEDSGRRWTFTLKMVLPVKTIEKEQLYAPKRQGSVEHFKFTYDTSWYTNYSGDSKDNLDRDSLNFVNNFGLYGPTPYGNLDGAVTLHKTDLDPTEATYYTMGLSDGNIAMVDDFHLRLFDSTTHFSDLTLPGRQIRGVLFQDKVYYDEVSYTILRGQARSTYGTVASPTISSKNESYVEGLRMKYKPSDDFGLGINYARAWGDDKSRFAKDRTVSVETENKFNENVSLFTEFAHDEDEMAQKARMNYIMDDETSFEVRARNIPSGYANVSGAPAGQGEVGTEFIYRKAFERFDFNTYLDLYRDHQIENPENPDAVNTDFNANVYLPFEDRSSWRSDFYYFHSPGLLSDDTDTRLSTTYSRLFNVFSRSLSTYVTGTTQLRRSDSNMQSDYDRNSITVGSQYSLTNNLSFSNSYEQYYVKDRGDPSDTVYPSVFYSALSYRRAINDQWRWNAGLSYRDEQRTESEKSFLAGEDSLTTSSGLTFSPNQDVDIYVDGRLRDIWSENLNNTSYTEASLNFGMRSTWDLGFAWNPSALVQGHVFKDVNSNGRKDDGEPGVAGVRVLIGEDSAVTDEAGWYYTQIKARTLVIGLDFDTVPDGYVFQDQSQEEFEIKHKDVIDHDIALATRSGIYGIVFVDTNGNKVPDANEEKLANVRVVLDGELTSSSDMRGAYFFNNIADGKHVLRIDINSIPLQYLPNIALEHKIEVSEGTTYMLHVPVSIKK